MNNNLTEDDLVETENWLKSIGINSGVTFDYKNKIVYPARMYTKRSITYISGFVKTEEDRNIFKCVFNQYGRTHKLPFIMYETERLINERIYQLSA